MFRAVVGVSDADDSDRKMVGDYGADMGLYLGMGFAGVSFPPLRYLEKKFVGR